MRFLCFLLLGLIAGHLTYGQTIGLVADLNPGTNNSSPNNMFVYKGEVYFGASRPAEGRELWKSDGTDAGTVLVKDLRPGSANSSPNFFFIFQDTLYFSANTGAGNVLFKTDGTEAGTVQVSADFVFRPVIVGDSLVYFVYTTQGNALFTFDGTSVLPAPNAGVGTAAIIGANYTFFQDKLILYMDYSEDQATVGRELYQYDLAADSFSLIKDISPGSGNSTISEFTVLGDKVYFRALTDLWVTDGTEAGTEPVASVVNAGITDVRSFYAWQDMLFFEADSGSGDQLFVYVPAQDTVRNISQISGPDPNHDPASYAPFNGYLYYRGEDGNDGNGHLFRTAGHSVEQLDTLIIDVDDIVRLGDALFFEADEPDVTGNEPFRFDTPLLIPVLDGPEVVCAGESAVLLASNAPSANWTYTWYADAEGSTVLGSGTPFTTDPLAAAVTFYAGIDSANVAGELVALTVTVNDELAGGVSINILDSLTLQAQPSGAAFSYQWLDSLGNAIAGATDSTYLPDTSGTFFVVVSGSLCSDTSAAFGYEAPLATALDAPLALGEIYLYPNPNQGQVHLRWTLEQPDALALSVRDLTGRLILRQEVPAGQQALDLNLSAQAAGMYLLQLRGPAGQWQQRLILE